MVKWCIVSARSLSFFLFFFLNKNGMGSLSRAGWHSTMNLLLNELPPFNLYPCFSLSHQQD